MHTRAAVLSTRSATTVRSAIGAKFEPLALLGELGGGGAAYLVRARESGELAVARLLKRRKGDTGGVPIVAMLRELDGSLPAPAAPCPSCATLLPAWAQKCTKCGARLVTSKALDTLLAREGSRYSFIGTLSVYGGGAIAFATRVADSEVVTLHGREWHSAEEGDNLVLVEAGPLERIESPTTTEEVLLREPATAEQDVDVAAPPSVIETAGDEVDAGEMPTRLIEIADRARHGAGHEPTSWVRPSDLGLGATPRTPPPTEPVAVPKVCPLCASEYETGARFCPKDGTALRPKGGTDPLIGQVIADRYHVLQRVGEGGMGRVYLAEHVRMGRMCALKVMRSQLLNDDEAMARFAREASNAARILHPNVAAVFDYGEADGVVYLVMEYVEGEALSTIVARERALPVPRVLDLAKQVTDALVAAHEMGVVHRDLKPDNILIARRGDREVAKVVDFGIAKAIAESPQEALTRSGLVIGTPEFMSPEQLLGDPVDARTDLYSLGCIIFLMLTGTQPAEAPTREAMLKRRLHELPPHPRAVNRALPPDLDAIVVRLLASTPAARYDSAADLRAALEGVRLEGADPTPIAPVEAQPEPARTGLRFDTPHGPRAPMGGRSRRLALTVGSLAVGAAAIALYASGIGRDSGTQAPAPPAAATSDSGRTASPRTGGSTDAVIRPGAPAGPGVGLPGTIVNKPVIPVPRADSAPLVQPPNPTDRAIVAPLQGYAAALQSGDIAQLRRAYGGMSNQEVRMREQQFKLAEVRAQVDGATIVEQTADRARIRFRLREVATYRNTGESARSNIRYQAIVVRRGSGWVLAELIRI